MSERVCRAIRKVKGQMRAAGKGDLPLLWTEWNVPGINGLRDTAFVGPALAHTIRGCDGWVDLLSFWTFSDVFEEGGPIPQPFEGHFGLRAKGGINKPSYYDFALLHRLGEERLANNNPDAIVTRRKDGKLAIAVWNYVDPSETGRARKYRLVFEHMGLSGAAVSISRVDEEHSNTLAAYRSLGSPQYPTEEQVRKLNALTALGTPTEAPLTGRDLDIELGPNALVLLEVTPGVTGK